MLSSTSVEEYSQISVKPLKQWIKNSNMLLKMNKTCQPSNKIHHIVSEKYRRQRVTQINKIIHSELLYLTPIKNMLIL